MGDINYVIEYLKMELAAFIDNCGEDDDVNVAHCRKALEEAEKIKKTMIGEQNEKYLLTGNDEVLSIKEGRTISLKEAVGSLAIRTFEDYVEYVNTADQEKKDGLKEKLLFQTKVLNSLSAALKSVT